MKCVLCDMELVMGECGPIDGTLWKSHGNYGSSVYDDMTGRKHLELVICDNCLVKRMKVIREAVRVVEVRERYEYRELNYES